MKRSVISFFFIFSVSLSVFAQLKVRDVFASAPDSIFPLLTKNNRLDCIDFKENSMEARVKNRLDGISELKILTSEYLFFQLTERSSAEMYVLSDSLFCLIQTFYGPTADSDIRFYKADWKPVNLQFPVPTVPEFFSQVPDSLQQAVRFAQRSLQELFLLRISVSEAKPEFTLELQLGELSKEEKETAQQFLRPLVVHWNGKEFVR